MQIDPFLVLLTLSWLAATFAAWCSRQRAIRVLIVNVTQQAIAPFQLAARKRIDGRAGDGLSEIPLTFIILVCALVLIIGSAWYFRELKKRRKHEKFEKCNPNITGAKESRSEFCREIQ
jgi:uncharacterized membrane protein YidH (DUF202 family)